MELDTVFRPCIEEYAEIVICICASGLSQYIYPMQGISLRTDRRIGIVAPLVKLCGGGSTFLAGEFHVGGAIDDAVGLQILHQHTLALLLVVGALVHADGCVMRSAFKFCPLVDGLNELLVGNKTHVGHLNARGIAT